MVAAFEGQEVSPVVYRKLLTDAVDEESLAVIYCGLHRLLQLALRLPLSSLKQEVLILVLPSFHFCEAGIFVIYLSPRCMATFIILSHRSLLFCCLCCPLFFLLLLSSLFRQCSHLSCGFLCFLTPCFFFSDLFGNLLSLILIMYPVHFIRLLTIWPIKQALLTVSSTET